MRFVSRVVAEGLVLLVRVYQWTLRPFIGAHCRFEPSCSHYAVEALRSHGAARGTVLSARRVLRCNPWTEGGLDPVPVRGVGPVTGPGSYPPSLFHPRGGLCRCEIEATIP